MSDTFHPAAIESNDTYWIIHSIVDTPKHIYILLTKRAKEMQEFMRRYPGGCNLCTFNTRPWNYDHIWHGVSVENQAAADTRIPLLLDTPCTHRWLSMEPLIAPVTLKPEWLGPGKIEWVVVGGESGPNARPMHPDWARAIRNVCQENHARFHFKQHGEWYPMGSQYEIPGELYFDDSDFAPRGDEIVLHRSGEIVEGYQPTDPRTWIMTRAGKKAAGRELDGRTYDWVPRPEGWKP